MKSKIKNYEMELIPRNNNEESTYVELDEKGYSLPLVELVENEFENDISDFKQIITRNASFPYEIVDKYNTIDYYKDLLDELKQPYHQVSEYVLLIFPTSSPMYETLPQTSSIVDDDVIILKLDLWKYDQRKFEDEDNADWIQERVDKM